MSHSFFAARRAIVALCGVLTAISLPVVAKADPFLIYNTGVDNSNALLTNGATDTHWTINGNAAVVTSAHPAWVVNGPDSKWISTVSNAGSVAGGTYLFRTTFSLDGFISSTALLSGRWTSDNKTVAVRLNGNSTGITNANEPFGGWGGFTINSGFISGLNTLEFEVFNGISGNPVNSPMGLRVEVAGTAARIPEPGTMALLLTGTVALAGTMKRRRTAR
jgi:hypothetical protein